MKQIFTVILICLSTNLFSQTKQGVNTEVEARNSVTIGLLQGGGSLVGADFEFLLSDYFGFQVGAGFLGVGTGLNIHFKPSIRSSFISFQYWNQGIGESFVHNAIGPNFVFRGKKWFTFQIGIGKILSRAETPPSYVQVPEYMLMYSIGAYIPLK